MHYTVFCDRRYIQRFGVKHWHKFHPLRLKEEQVHSTSCIRPEKKHQSINYPTECIMLGKQQLAIVVQIYVKSQ